MGTRTEPPDDSRAAPHTLAAVFVFGADVALVAHADVRALPVLAHAVRLAQASVLRTLIDVCRRRNANWLKPDTQTTNICQSGYRVYIVGSSMCTKIVY